VAQEDFEVAKDKVLMGAERKSMIISEKERKATAIHEAGHALVAFLLPEADPLHKVTIIPRGRALGLTQLLPVDDKHTYSRTHLEATIAVMMGGRVAEELRLNQRTTGAGNDLERVTDLARKMVCEWGMSEKLGPLTFGKKEEQIFLGREISQHRDYSEDTAQVIDEEVKTIVMAGYAEARQILHDNGDALMRIADALLEREVLDLEEVKLLVKGLPLPSRDEPRTATGPTPPPTLAEPSRTGPAVLPEPNQPA
jgi:cell division protease FtsH